MPRLVSGVTNLQNKERAFRKNKTDTERGSGADVGREGKDGLVPSLKAWERSKKVRKKRRAGGHRTPKRKKLLDVNFGPGLGPERSHQEESQENARMGCGRKTYTG